MEYGPLQIIQAGQLKINDEVVSAGAFVRVVEIVETGKRLQITFEPCSDRRFTTTMRKAKRIQMSRPVSQTVSQ